MPEVIGEFISYQLTFGGMGSLVGLVSYAVTALALYTLAQNRGIHKPWLAWIPVCNQWILGSLSDQYRYVVKGENKSKRKVLLILGILNSLLGLVTVVRVGGMLLSAIVALTQGMQSEQLLRLVVNGLLNSVLWAIPGLIVSLCLLVYEAMALYDIFTSCDKANNVLYLVLSVIPVVSQITRPLFLFLCRNKDEGMPPRREEA